MNVSKKDAAINVQELRDDLNGLFKRLELIRGYL